MFRGQQYGFLLTVDSLGINGEAMTLGAQTDENSYLDGLAIRRINP